MYLFAGILLLVLVLFAVWMLARLTARFQPRPCPTSLVWLLDNPLTAGYHKAILERLELGPGLSVLDAGCGPGLLAVPIARAVGPEGNVVGLDVQEGMLEKARAAAALAHVSNLTFLRAGLGEGRLPAAAFDRAVLVTVLGEIPDRTAALREIYSSLKPGGFLSITEVLPDPDYQPRGTVKRLAQGAGFRVGREFGGFFMFTVNVERPLGA
jgi:ubiquinone/menaquinone biosynthesis C-methylase UbiE